jgi:transposase
MESQAHPSSTPAEQPEKIGATVRFQFIHGIKYFYQDYPYWDKEKKQTRHKRTYIGHEDKNGGFVPSKVKNIQDNQLIIEINGLPSHKYFGVSYLLDNIVDRIHLKDDLKEIFPDDYLEILSLAYYRIVTGGAAYYRFEKWHKKHHHPGDMPICSQRISELLPEITDNKRYMFFDKIIQRRLADEFLAYDTTSISSYSELLKKLKYGLSKDDDNLPQVNLALVIGEKSYIPVYYRLLPGNINDTLTVDILLDDLRPFGVKNLNFVMDRGFYGLDNIIKLLDNEHKFIIGVKSNLIYVKQSFPDAYKIITNNDYFLPNFGVYGFTKKILLPGKIRIQNFNVVDYNKRPVNLHIYYDPEKAIDEQHTFQKNLSDSIIRFNNNSALPEDIKRINSYCIIDDKGDIKTDSVLINEKLKKFGFFYLLSNTKLNISEVLEIYRNKDIVEKSFNNIKNSLGGRRPQVHSIENFEGSLFIQFIGLILIFCIHKVMKETNLYKNYTIDSLLDELDLIEQYVLPNNQVIYSEITGKQIDIFKKFNIAVPKKLN